jgi:putative DNA primase/helicase
MPASTPPSDDRKPSTHCGDLKKLAPALAKALAHRPNFVLWKWVWDPENTEWTKPPFQARSPRKNASTTKPATWATYQEAVATLNHADGLGVVLTDLDGITGIDLDHCRDPETGDVAPWAKGYLDEAEALGAYVEVSVSGTGFHVVGISNGAAMDNNWKIPGAHPKAKVEVYHKPKGRYLTISAAQFGTCADPLPNISKFVDDLIKRLKSAKTDGKRPIEDIITDGSPEGQRSEDFNRVVWSLASRGLTVEQIEARLEEHPDGIVKKYDGRLRQEVERSYEKWLERPTVLDPSDPFTTACTFVAAKHTTGGVRTIHRYRGAFWKWTGSYYRLADDETMRSEIWDFLSKAQRLSDGAVKPFKPNRSHVGNVFDALIAATQLDESIEAPAWLGRYALPADEFTACNNGLLHLPTRKVYPATPEFFCVVATDVAYDPQAPKPPKWHQFLDQLFGKDDESRLLLQEQFGYFLSADTSHQKIFMLVGPRRSGKGTIARILTAVLGKASVAGPTLSSLGFQFGLEPLITKSLAIISDARVDAKANKSVIVERTLSISGEDTMTVDRKFRQSWHGKLPTRLMIISNDLISLPEGSGAFAGRIMLLLLTNSFYGKEDRALTKKLQSELPGIFNWTLDGYTSLAERGHFKQPKRSEDAIEQIEMLGAPVKAFVRDHCEVGVNFEAPTDNVWQEWKHSCQEEGRTNPGIKDWFTRNLASAVPGLTVKKRRTKEGARYKIYSGIRLRKAEEPEPKPEDADERTLTNLKP